MDVQQYFLTPISISEGPAAVDSWS